MKENKNEERSQNYIYIWIPKSRPGRYGYMAGM